MRNESIMKVCSPSRDSQREMYALLIDIYILETNSAR